MEKSFTREDTRAMKGIAVIMLLVGHLWPFTDRHPAGFEWTAPFGLYDPRWIEIIGWAAHITLYVFLFLGGYGLYHQIKRGTKLHEVLLGLYRNFWKVFVIMIPIAFIFFSNQPSDFLSDTSLCSRYASFSLRDLAMNFLGLEFTYNSEWWFITAYAAAIVTGYLLILALGRSRSFWVDAAAVTVLGVLIIVINSLKSSGHALSALEDNFIFYYLFNSSAVPFYMGIVFAKHNGLARLRTLLERYTKPWRALIALIGLFLIFVIRQTEAVTYDMDVLIVPFFVVLCMTLVDLLPAVKKALAYLGRHCNNIWLVHSFYCFYFYAATRLVYCTTDAVLSLIILLGLSLGSSIAIDGFYSALRKLSSRLKKTAVKA